MKENPKLSPRQERRVQRINETNPSRAEKVQGRMEKRYTRATEGPKSKLKRPDTPLAPTPEPNY